MPRFAANLSMMYQEHAFLDRFSAAAEDGFRAVEFLFPYAHPAAEVAARLRSAGVVNVLFNLPPGDWDRGERGIAALPGREAEFASALDTALVYADALDCPRLHVMAGIPARDADRAACRATYLANLRLAAARAAAIGRDVLIEPINTRDIPGYFLNRQDEAQAIRAEVGASNLKVQFDLYHCQIVEGDLATKLRRDIGHIGHMQIAGVPERHEPDRGEVNYPFLFDVIDSLGYAGWIGCEYRPRAGTRAGLEWVRRYLVTS
jgi:hydroxypyruvate isomerase